MRQLALFSIEVYQRYLSPHKGFCCAYRAHTGRRSCSALGYRAIRRYGVVDGMAVLRQRLRKCGVVHRRHHMQRQRGALRSQRGDCDPGCDASCDGCDTPDIDCPGLSLPKGLCDAASCCDCGSCDCGDWRNERKRKKDEQQVYIPPTRSRANESSHT
jgi:putative component of membrane protein insertase Oxa1/YidC/SpoIIIJ protein YidD